MKAAVLEELNKIVVKEVPTPEIDDNGILVKVKSCSICGSDIRTFRHGNSRVQTPSIIGHEVAGEVVEVGSNVTRFKVGERVAIGADVPCGECQFCIEGIGNNCQINYAIGYQFQGGFAEYIPLNGLTVNYGPVQKIPDHVSFDEAALTEPLGCVLNGMELSDIKLGDNVAIIGTGPIGCMIIEVVRKMGAAKIMVIDISTERLEVAKEFAADVFIDSSKKNAIERVLKETNGLGADVVITACSSPQAQMDALKMAKNRARVNFFGGLPKGESMITIDSNIIHYKEIFVHGTHGSTPRHYLKALNLIASGVIDIKKFISHNLPLEDILKGFEIAENKKGKRVVINP